MEAALPTFAPFSPDGYPATAKILVLGPAPAGWIDRFRSLNLEHVSAAELVRQEISRHSPSGHQARRALDQGRPVPDEAVLAPLRRWFWTRKPDAGFALSDFPATMLQAVVFDEWLEVRGTGLTGIVAPAEDSVSPLVDHYRTLGVEVLDAGDFFQS